MSAALRGSRSETLLWLYMRLSGLALLFLVLGHMFLMHVLVGLNQISFAFVEARWAGAGWRAYDLVMLLLAMSHAANGVRGLAYDHLASRRSSIGLLIGYAGCLFVTVLGSWVILTFPSPV